MRKLANADIRQVAKDAGVSLWELADELHISEPTLTRMLRHELSDVEKSDMLCSIGDVVDRHRAMGCSPI